MEMERQWDRRYASCDHAEETWDTGRALALGITTNYTHLKVFEKDGYLYVYTAGVHDNDGARLDEHLPGLFFTLTGECLNLRGPKLTWQNWRIKKVDNDNDGNFDINFFGSWIQSQRNYRLKKSVGTYNTSRLNGQSQLLILVL